MLLAHVVTFETVTLFLLVFLFYFVAKKFLFLFYQDNNIHIVLLQICRYVIC